MAVELDDKAARAVCHHTAAPIETLPFATAQDSVDHSLNILGRDFVCGHGPQRGQDVFAELAILLTPRLHALQLLACHKLVGESRHGAAPRARCQSALGVSGPALDLAGRQNGHFATFN